MYDKLFPLYILVFFSTLILTAAIERVIIPRLSGCAKQPIYEDGPKWHMKKQGTPTMGGLAFLLSVSASLILSSLLGIFFFSYEATVSIILSLLYAILNSLV